MLFVQVAIPRSFGNLQRLTLLSLAHLGSPLLVVIAEDEDRVEGGLEGRGGTGRMRKGAASKCFLECFSPLCTVLSAQCAQCSCSVCTMSLHCAQCQLLSTVSVSHPPTNIFLILTDTTVSPKWFSPEFCLCPEVQFRGITKKASSLGVSLSWMCPPVCSSFCRTYGCSIRIGAQSIVHFTAQTQVP